MVTFTRVDVISVAMDVVARVGGRCGECIYKAGHMSRASTEPTSGGGI